ncbi:hypothetical protein D3C73_1250990 [compost metagenome]
MFPPSVKSEADTLKTIGIVSGTTSFIAFNTSSKNLALFSKLPPYSSSLLFDSGDKNSFIKYPCAPCTSIKSKPAFTALRAPFLNDSTTSLISSLVNSLGVLLLSSKAISDGATISPGYSDFLPA